MLEASRGRRRGCIDEVVDEHSQEDLWKEESRNDLSSVRRESPMA